MAYTEEQQAIINAAKARAAAGASAPPAPAEERTREQIIADASARAASKPSVAEDAAKSFGSGIVKGTTALADLPGDIVSGGFRAAEYLTGTDIPEWMERAAMVAMPGAMQRGITGESITEGMTRELPSVMEYKPQTTAGRYAGTVGEFVPGAAAAALTGGTSMLPTVARGALLPGVASEAAGQVAEKYLPNSTWAEPAARLAGSILGGVATSGAERAIKSLISPSGGASPMALQAADELRSAGVPVTAGQATGGQFAKSIEANNPQLQAMAQVSKDGAQLKQFTTAGLRMSGLTDDVVDDIVRQARIEGAAVDPTLANPITMRVLGDSLGKRFDDALSGVDYTPDRKLVDAIMAARGPNGSMPHGMQPFVALSTRIGNAVRNGQTIPASELQTMRSALGPYTTSQVTAHRQAAYLLRDALDDAIDDAVRLAGQPERMQALLKVRQDYQNYMALEAALKVGSGLGVNGIITPQDLARAVAAQGKRRMITGGRDTGNLAMAGVDRLGALPAPTRSLGRSTGAALLEGAGSALAYPLSMGYMSAIPFAGPAAGVAAGAAGVDAVRRLALRQLEKYAHTPAVQRYLGNQLVDPTSVPSAMAPALSGAITSERTARKSGGRVGVNHNKLADQLVGAAERAKKGISSQTEALLDMHDDHIAHALEVANRSI